MGGSDFYVCFDRQRNNGIALTPAHGDKRVANYHLRFTLQRELVPN